MTFASNFQRQQLDTEGWSRARAVLGVSTQAREGTRCCLQGVGAALAFPRTIYMDTALSTSLGRDPLCLCECTTNSKGDIGGKSTSCEVPAGVFQRRRDLVFWTSQNLLSPRCRKKDAMINPSSQLSAAGSLNFQVYPSLQKSCPHHRQQILMQKG